MKKLIITIISALLLIASSGPLYAHGDGDEDHDHEQMQMNSATEPMAVQPVTKLNPLISGTHIMGVEIVPNLHPIFVHFTVALLSISALLFVISRLAPVHASWKTACITAAQCNLWIGCIITLGTILAGLDAYNTVNHDGPSHIAMLEHRSWAAPTAGIFIVLAIWSFLTRKREPSLLFVLGMIIATAPLTVTAYKGAELVYRHGVGVMALPLADHHHHEEESEHHD